MAETNKRRINAKDAVKDIRSGMADSDLREKYGLSATGLDSLFTKLVGAGLLQQHELDRPSSPKDRSVHVAWKCPACGSSQTREYAECPDCGVIVAKFSALHAGGPEHEGRQADAAVHEESYSRDGSWELAAGEELPNTQLPRSEAEPTGIVAAPGVGTRAPSELFDQSEDHEEAGADELEDMVPEPLSMDKTDWLMLLVCPAVALLCFVVFWFRWTLETFKTLVHEMGHAIFGWVFAYPSFPAFDVIWGGGVTLHTQRSTTLLILIYIGFAGLLWLYRKNRATVVFLIAVACIHALFSYTSIHSILIIFMGHGTELVIAGLFIYRALTGRAVVHAVERPLYGIIGFFIVFSDLAFAYRLLTSAAFRAEYASAKGGDIDMDFARIAGDYLHVSMNSVVLVFFICCLLCLVLSFLAFRYMEYLHAAVVALWVREPQHHDELSRRTAER